MQNEEGMEFTNEGVWEGRHSAGRCVPCSGPVLIHCLESLFCANGGRCMSFALLEIMGCCVVCQWRHGLLGALPENVLWTYSTPHRNHGM